MASSVQVDLLARCDAVEFSRTTRPYLDHFRTVDAARIGSPTVNAAKHIDMKFDLAGSQAAQSALYNANGHKTSALHESIAKAFSDDAPAVSKVQACRQNVTHRKRSNNTKAHSILKRAQSQSQTTLDALHQRSAALLFTVKQNNVKLHALVSGPR
jgi:hypothetical protein